MSFTFGTALKMHIFGESHGKNICAIVEGFPSGIGIIPEKIQLELDKRKPGQSLLVTQRQEQDSLEILSGISEGKSTGAPITLAIRNEDIISAHYNEFRAVPRPGHADFTASVKFGSSASLNGGGIFSGRMTAALVMGGALSRQLPKMKGISVKARLISIGHLKTVNNGELTGGIRQHILKLRKEGDSVGGIIECTIDGVPAGIGEPFFDSIESVLSHAMFSIPAVKGIEFGSGFKCASMKGSEHNDAFAFKMGKIVTKTNNSGGILGGISNGMPVVFRIAIKPASSIAKKQETLNIQTMEETTLQVKGRHDPCIAIRAVPVVENLAAFVIADLMLRSGGGKRAQITP